MDLEFVISLVGEIGNPRLTIEWWDTPSANSKDLEPAHMRSLFSNVQFVLAKARVQLNCYCYTFHVIKKGKWKIFSRTALDWTSFTFTTQSDQTYAVFLWKLRNV